VVVRDGVGANDYGLRGGGEKGHGCEYVCGEGLRGGVRGSDEETNTPTLPSSHLSNPVYNLGIPVLL
jgi:hypothetical protein